MLYSLYDSLLDYTMLYYTMLYYTTLYCTIPSCDAAVDTEETAAQVASLGNPPFMGEGRQGQGKKCSNVLSILAVLDRKRSLPLPSILSRLRPLATKGYHQRGAHNR